MGFFSGLISLLTTILLWVIIFLVEFAAGFILLYVTIRKFAPEAWLVLDEKIHADNKKRVEEEMASKEGDV